MEYDLNKMFNVSPEFASIDEEVMKLCKPYFDRADSIGQYNQCKVLKAFIDNRISAEHLVGTTGYGHGDKGRDGLDKLFAQIVGAEDSLCRYNFTSGTHTISTALFGVLRSGDRMVCATGTPYDTLHGVIGIDGSHYGNLMDYNIEYDECPLLEDSAPDLNLIEKKCKGAKVCYIQRSRGYAKRKALSLNTIKSIATVAKKSNKDIIVIVDNCYGEYTQKEEPTAYGADLIIGSLIKNPGGGIAPTGGYIAGRSDLVELCGHRLTAPGSGRELGCSLDVMREMYMGVYLGPTVTCNAVKSSIYASCLFEKLGYETHPHYSSDRNDIITLIDAESKENLIALCRGIQSYSPIDSFASPEPGPMAGYEDEIIMASGSFTMGSSIELSCDAPLRTPFTAYMQGGTTFAASRMAILKAAENLKK
jgi:cystathionine beta-lyase family protein involved in aluminum resistance